MEDQPVRRIASVPEAEANELAKRLRHRKELHGCGISVYAYVPKSGVPALHVAVDFPPGEGIEGDRYDIRYKAETDVKILERNAVKRILSKWAGRT